jgi:hypothetical protein
MQFVLPIYYEQIFKTKDPKVWLVGMNAYRNWHYHLKNKVKHYFHELVTEAVIGFTPIDRCFTLNIDVYYKNRNCDGSNIASLTEKMVLDALQLSGIVINDNVKYHLGTTWRVAGQDKENPRCVITIHPTEKDCDV